MEVAFTGAAAFMAAADTGESIHFNIRKLPYGEQDHAHYKFENRDTSSQAG